MGDPEALVEPPYAFHLFERDGDVLLFDPSSSALFALDANGEAAVRALVGGRQTGGAREALEQSGQGVGAALREFSALRRRGFFSTDNPPVPHLVPDRPYDFSVFFSRRCNLRCRYCYAGHDSDAGVPLHMSSEVMEATARLIAQRNALRRQRDDVVVGNGGEATLDLEAFDTFNEALERQGRGHGISLKARLCLSNLTTTDVPSVGKRLHQICGVSIDGPPAIHDAMRVYPDGRGTYRDVLEGISRLKAARDLPAALATLAVRRREDVLAVYEHLRDLGFGAIQVKPVRCHPGEPYAIARNLDAVCAGYQDFVEHLLRLPGESQLRFLVLIAGDLDTGDYFGRFFVRLRGGMRANYRCLAWLSRATIDTDGRVYACDSLVGIKEACIGSVWEGIDEGLVAEMAERLHVSRRAPCSRCWARFVCGGGCMHQSYLTYGSFDAPDPAECRLNRHLVELAGWLSFRLGRDAAEVLAALPLPASQPPPTQGFEAKLR